MKQSPPDRFVIGGVGVAIILAIVAGFATHPSRSVVLGAAIGLGGTMLSLQVNTLAKLDRGSQLEKALAGVSWLRPMVVSIAESAAAAERDERLEPFRAAAKKEVQRCVNRLQDIARGQLRATAGEGILERRKPVLLEKKQTTFAHSRKTQDQRRKTQEVEPGSCLS
jgi:hypothetical protein